MSNKTEEVLSLFKGVIETNPLKKQLEDIDPFDSTNDNSIRRSGNTTRLINKYVEYLFKHDVVIPIDHHYSTVSTKENVQRASEHLVTKMLSRLANELNCPIRPESSNLKGLSAERLTNGFTIIKLNK